MGSFDQVRLIESFDETHALFDLINPPPQLYVRGEHLDLLLGKDTVAIVGSRDVSLESIAVAKEYARTCAEQGIVVVSGLANGIDSAAFEGALSADGICIAVLPSPVDNVVPSGNVDLAKSILEKGGCIVSEYDSGVKPKKWMFLHRNRIIAAISKKVVIGEARKGGGAWNTIEHAWKMNRPTFSLSNSGELNQISNPQRGLFDE